MCKGTEKQEFELGDGCKAKMNEQPPVLRKTCPKGK